MKRSFLILGSGRSGTSMVAALLRDRGLHFGHHLIRTTRANPLGYYEDTEVNNLNTDIIDHQVFRPLARFFPRMLRPSCHRERRAFWLAAPLLLVRLRSMSPQLMRRMQTLLSETPFCYKDPRFNVTLPFWERELPVDTRRVVVFRDPRRTVDSILRDAGEFRETPLPVTARWAYMQYIINYARLLRWSRTDARWMFVHYDDVLSGSAWVALSGFTEGAINTEQVEATVSRARTRSHLRVDAWLADGVYGRLRRRSRANISRWRDRTRDPEVSVILPIRGEAPYLRQAIDSVLAQTFSGFELWVVDNGCDDGVLDVLRCYARKDHRVRVLPCSKPGIVAALNAGLRVARADFVARMDADDLCTPTRFAEQVAYLREHTDVWVLGGRAIVIGPDGREIQTTPTPIEHEDIEDGIIHGGLGRGIIHPTVMMRRRDVMTLGGYRAEFAMAEDADLWLRVAERAKLANLSSRVLKYRVHPNSASYLHAQEQARAKRRVLEDMNQRRAGNVRVLPVRRPPARQRTVADCWALWSEQAKNAGNPRTARLYAVRAFVARMLNA